MAKTISYKHPEKTARSTLAKSIGKIPLRATLSRSATPEALEPYDWGTAGIPKGQPIKFIPGEGWKIG